MLLLACMTVTGACLAQAFASPRGLAESVAYALLFGLTVIPFVVLGAALGTGHRVSLPLLAGVSVVVTITSGLAWWRTRGDRQGWLLHRSDVLLVGAAGIVGLAAAAYGSSEEALLSLASYALRGEAKCFYHLTFQLVEALNPGAPFEPGRDLVDILSTPGNAIFTAPFVPILGIHAFRFAYAAIQVLTFLFVALGVRRWGGRSFASLAAGLVAVASPFALSIEVLDRNAIAFALTAALFYTLETRPRRPLLHGWLFAIAAGTGLRFLPLLNLVLVGGAYLSHRARLRTWLAFGAAAAATFALNLPHLATHGLHSLGETLGAWALTVSAFADGYRTPLQPLPAGLQYLQQSLSHLGAVGAGLVLAGAVRSWSTRRREAASLVVVSAAVWFVLAIQRDWIEGDKARIWLYAWLPVPFFAGMAIEWLSTRGHRLRSALWVAAGALVALGTTAAIVRVEAPPDPGSGSRKPVYQSDTPSFARFYRTRFASTGLFPDYARVDDKRDLGRKRRLERATMETLAGAMGRSELSEVGWFREAFETERAPGPAPTPGEPTLSIEIDLERLVSDPDHALRAAAPDAQPFVDLSRPDTLLDVCHKEVPVSWQPQPLTVTTFPLRREVRALREVHLELDAFASLGRDLDGFERVAAIHMLRSKSPRTDRLRQGLRALPQADEEPRVVLRVPAGFRVVLRYWVIDGRKGTPFRVDSWRVVVDPEGQPRAEFRPCEPESYL